MRFWAARRPVPTLPCDAVRRLYLLLVGLGIVAFLVVSALLARAWNAEGTERAAITALVAAEARGDTADAVDRLQDCQGNRACQASTARLVDQLRRAGRIAILQLQPSTGFSLTASTGTARVAWNTSSTALPVVQCVRVHRAGDVIRGLRIELLAITPRLRSDSDCPRSF